MKRILPHLLIACLFLSSNVFADTADKVNQWFDNMGYANVTAPGVVEGQSARYYTLGGISTRSEITQPFRFVNVQTPRFSAGCGGIDFYAGGFSAINADQFIANLRAIGQNAASLAFMLGIQIVSPQLSGLMGDINELAQDFNSLNMSSCDAATKLVGGVMEKFGVEESNCVIKRMQDFGEDWTNANHNCTTGGNKNNTENAGDSPNEIAFTKGNLAWSVLMQDPLFNTDLQFAEVMINLTGTIIISDAGNDDDTPNVLRKVPAAIDDEGNFTEQGQNIFRALLLGDEFEGDLQYFNCNAERNNDPDGCTSMSDQLQDLAVNWQGLKDRVNDEIMGIINNIYTEQELTDVQLGIIRTTRIPLYKYLTVIAAYYPRGMDLRPAAGDYVEMIAIDILFRNLTAVVEKARQSISLMPNGLGQSKDAIDYENQISAVLKGFNKLREKNTNDMELFISMETRMRNYERAIVSKLGAGMVQSAQWGR